VNDCFAATKYILNNEKEFDADLTRLVLAGDSAGGNVVAVMTQRLLAEGLQQPKLQVLIYPWLQMVHFRLPCMIKYGKTDYGDEYFTLLYMGVRRPSRQMAKEMRKINHVELIDDRNVRARVKSCLDVSEIPAKYKTGKKYYSKVGEIRNDKDVKAASLIYSDGAWAALMAKLHDPSVSPLLADQESLVGLPRAYMIVFESDTVKDECLLYAERLKKAGVDVDLVFYDDGSRHGVATQTDHKRDGKRAKAIQDDLIGYLSTHL
jgi:acetyl esterase/lipase